MILDKETAQRKLRRMALEISEKNYDKNSLLLIGIKSNGIFIAKKIAEFLKESFTGTVELLEMTVNKKNPIEVSIDKNVDFNGKSIILIDDVLYTGRTIRAAMDALVDYGRPAKVELLILIDRKFDRQLPIQPDYVGKSIDSVVTQKVKVLWEGESNVVLY